MEVSVLNAKLIIFYQLPISVYQYAEKVILINFYFSKKVHVQIVTKFVFQIHLLKIVKFVWIIGHVVSARTINFCLKINLVIMNVGKDFVGMKIVFVLKLKLINVLNAQIQLIVKNAQIILI